MHRLLLVLSVAAILFARGETVSHAADRGAPPTATRIDSADWPWWRGPNRNGVAASDQHPPLSWSDDEHIAWKTKVPGHGHGSPTVVGDQIFLATADHDRQTQSVLCFDRHSGEQRWQTDIHHGGLTAPKLNAKASLASATVACDGDRLFISFWNDGAVYTTALSRDGNQLWQEKITDYVVHQGFGSSPAIYGPLVIISADNKGGGAVVALDRITGETVWRNTRPKLPNYASPIILPVAGHEQLLFIGCNRVSSFEPLTGRTIWEIEGATTECVTSTVTNGELIFTSGGFPKNHIAAVRADGSGEVVWEHKTRVYVPSLLSHSGYLYGVLDAGVAACWDSTTGAELWKGRLGGTFSASPVLVGEHIFATNESGRTFIFKASPTKFVLVGENSLGDHVMATPTFCGSRIFMRVAQSTGGQRQEWLYCIGERDQR